MKLCSERAFLIKFIEPYRKEVAKNTLSVINQTHSGHTVNIRDKI